MTYLKKVLWTAIVLAPTILCAQQNSGIMWESGLSWDQVKAKAKQQNKYIFLDCYTTWCGPCKQMDKSTYLNESVGDFFNEKFISVKVQMDKTENDAEEIKNWYSDAEAIGKKYHVGGYPCFVFFTPVGEVIHKSMGFLAAADFIAVGQAAVAPGKEYNDEYAMYDNFVWAFKNGERTPDQYPAMIKMALKGNDGEMVSKLSKELNDYLLMLPPNKRYTKELVELWSNPGITLSSKSRTFNFFYKDGRFIDEVMGYKGYSEDVVDRTIQQEICVPFMEEQSKPTGIAMSGMYLTGSGLKGDFTEADWRQLDSMIRKKFGKSYAKRSLLTAKIEWYARHKNSPAFVKHSLLKLKKYPPDLINKPYDRINSIGWNAFVYSNDKATLSACIRWMEKIIKRKSNVGEWVDTYANLLYKVGRKDEAIQWEQKALALAPGYEVIQQALENMKNGLPTHVELGAEWSEANKAALNSK